MSTKKLKGRKYLAFSTVFNKYLLNGEVQAYKMGFPGGSGVKNLPTMQETEEGGGKKWI